MLEPPEVLVLQTGTETFDVRLSDQRLTARLPGSLRDGLGLRHVPAPMVVETLVAMLRERDALPTVSEELDLGRAIGRHPEALEELRARLA